MGEFGICDGTNPIDGNRLPAGQPGAGYPAFGQPGRATDADGDGVFEPAPCYAWNNTLNGAKLNMVLRRWGPQETALQAEHVKEGRDFFNEAPKDEYYQPYPYPHPLQGGWETLMKGAAASARAEQRGEWRDKGKGERPIGCPPDITESRRPRQGGGGRMGLGPQTQGITLGPPLSPRGS